MGEKRYKVKREGTGSIVVDRSKKAVSKSSGLSGKGDFFNLQQLHAFIIILHSNIRDLTTFILQVCCEEELHSAIRQGKEISSHNFPSEMEVDS